jgi:phage gpG-like protein
MVSAEIPRLYIGDDYFRQVAVVSRDIEIMGRKFNDFRTPLELALEDVIMPSIEKNFALGGRPPWPPLAASTVVNRGGSYRPILFRTGKLFNSVMNRANWNLTSTFVTLAGISNKVFYARYHQFGTAKMPARPYVEFQLEDVLAIEEIFGHWVDYIADSHWRNWRA